MKKFKVYQSVENVPWEMSPRQKEEASSIYGFLLDKISDERTRKNISDFIVFFKNKLDDHIINIKNLMIAIGLGRTEIKELIDVLLREGVIDKYKGSYRFYKPTSLVRNIEDTLEKKPKDYCPLDKKDTTVISPSKITFYDLSSKHDIITREYRDRVINKLSRHKSFTNTYSSNEINMIADWLVFNAHLLVNTEITIENTTKGLIFCPDDAFTKKLLGNLTRICLFKKASKNSYIGSERIIDLMKNTGIYQWYNNLQYNEPVKDEKPSHLRLVKS